MLQLQNSTPSQKVTLIALTNGCTVWWYNINCTK